MAKIGQNWSKKWLQKTPNIQKRTRFPKWPKLVKIGLKNGYKKHLIFEKGQGFENGQNWSKCMGYALGKMLTLGQKLKF